MKLPQISGYKLIKILSKAGYRIVRKKGSHVRLEKKFDGEIIKLTIPVHEKLKKGTLSRIIKDSRLSDAEFESL
ncbi:MAG: type II toxin-antitoxin system HicA family toxin [Candidatus Marinimicrobia bacterium]|nr:type II toxin-antitoxin system HicA family toxin [Candidatus Neomarinimicrobiota bacterium]